MKNSLFYNKLLVLFGLFFICATSFAQSVSGIVTSPDENDEPLIGVNILIKGTKKGTTTNAEGKFRVTAKAGDVLVFSFLGHTTQEITVGESTKLTVELKTDAQQMAEIEVVGFANVTGLARRRMEWLQQVVQW